VNLLTRGAVGPAVTQVQEDDVVKQVTGKVTVGEPAPEFTLPALEGRTVRLADYRGKRLILFMWASW